MAAVNIGMSEAQRLEFRDVIAGFVGGYHSAMLKIARGNNATDVERRMKSKHRSLFRKLDEQMNGMLTPEQFERYGEYRVRLEAKLTNGDASDSDAYLDWELAPTTSHH